MKRLISILFPLAAFLVALTPAYGQEEKDYALVGSVVGSNSMLLCTDKKEAIGFLETWLAKGQDAAETYWKAQKDCTVAAGTFMVGDVQYIANLPNGDFGKVVAIVTEDGPAYWVTTIRIVKKGQHDI